VRETVVFVASLLLRMAESGSVALMRRPRRNRRTVGVRAMVRETVLLPEHLVLPIFVQEGENARHAIPSMPDCFRLSVDLVVEICKEAVAAGVFGVALFPAVDNDAKDELATESVNPDGLLQRCVRAIKTATPDIVVITDVAMDPYSTQGHDGFVTEDGRIDNEKTVPILTAMAVAQAKAGADIVAPSDMMDGRVAAIRKALDEAGFLDVGICSYCCKYCSAFYGPFRDALDSAPKGGGKHTYQMDPANSREALVELRLDEEEGADWVMVKPGMPYLDIVRLVRDNTQLPVAIYHVSGEYAMLKAAAAQGWLNYDSCLLEALTSMRRAGANIIFTYAAIHAAKLLKEQRA